MNAIKKDASFMNEDFLLQNDMAKKLYHDYAAKMPIIDYHNHLSAEKIAKNEGFEDITEAWLGGDHYKWRGMRANGIDERYITGDATGFDKFQKWAETVPYTMRSPLFHWTHLELKHYFGINELLQPSSSEAIYKETSAYLQKTTAQQLLTQANVELVCTTDDPTDDLYWHQQIAKGDFQTRVLPTFRSDNIADINSNQFVAYIEKFASVSNTTITSLPDLIEALKNRVNYFHDNGCRLSDYGLTGSFSAVDFKEDEVDVILKKRLLGNTLSLEENLEYRSCIMYHLAVMYHEKGWAQQYHLGPIRNNNNRLIKEFGADAGCDSIGDYTFATELSQFFNRLDEKGQLAKTITYNLNPAHSEVFATMMGNFNTGGTPGKMQWGAAWWFLDQKDGIEKQINVLSNMGLLSRFVGMLTDSRSFLSFPRHEYFRRILCNMIGTDMENGELPNDLDFLGKMVQDICYHNAVNYFGFNKK